MARFTQAFHAIGLYYCSWQQKLSQVTKSDGPNVEILSAPSNPVCVYINNTKRKTNLTWHSRKIIISTVQFRQKPWSHHKPRTNSQLQPDVLLECVQCHREDEQRAQITWILFSSRSYTLLPSFQCRARRSFVPHTCQLAFPVALPRWQRSEAWPPRSLPGIPWEMENLTPSLPVRGKVS